MKKILVIQTASIGDVILATPLLEKLHQFYPKAKIDFLTKKGNEELFESHPYLGKLYIWDKKQNKYKNLKHILFEIRNENYDLVVNVQRFFTTGLLTTFSKAKETIGFSKNPFSIFFSKRFKHSIGKKGKPFVHEVERNLSLIEHLTNKEFIRPRLYPTTEQYNKVSDLKNHKFICIAPSSLWFTKQFPEQKWIELIKHLDKSLYFYFLGGKSDTETCNRIIKETNIQNYQNLAGKLSLLESAALMRDAATNFVNDSSPMHLASSVDAKTVAIFCSTIPEFGFGPLSTKNKIIQTNINLKCRPCGLHGYTECPEKHFKCAFTIDSQILASNSFL